MLQSLHVKNLALIDEAEVDFTFLFPEAMRLNVRT